MTSSSKLCTLATAQRNSELSSETVASTPIVVCETLADSCSRSGWAKPLPEEMPGSALGAPEGWAVAVWEKVSRVV